MKIITISYYNTKKKINIVREQKYMCAYVWKRFVAIPLSKPSAASGREVYCRYDWVVLYLKFRLYKAVATNFEVVRPGSGCGLFSVGVVFLCRCGLLNVGVVLFA